MTKGELRKARKPTDRELLVDAYVVIRELRALVIAGLALETEQDPAPAVHPAPWRYLVSSTTQTHTAGPAPIPAYIADPVLRSRGCLGGVGYTWTLERIHAHRFSSRDEALAFVNALPVPSWYEVVADGPGPSAGRVCPGHPFDATACVACERDATRASLAEALEALEEVVKAERDGGMGDAVKLARTILAKHD